MHQFNIDLKGFQQFTEEELYLLEQDTIEGVVCIRSIEGTVIIKAPVKISINEIIYHMNSPLQTKIS